MKRRGFLKAFATAGAVAAASPIIKALPLPKTVEEIKPEHLTKEPQPEKAKEVMFIVGRNEIVTARVLHVHEDGRLDLEARVRNPNAGAYRHRDEPASINANFLRVRRAKSTDFQNWGCLPGTWFLPFDLSAEVKP